MKKIYTIQVVILIGILMAGLGCTPNARPFEMLLGIAPTGDVDFLNLPIVTPASVTTYSNSGDYDSQSWSDDSGFDLTVVGSYVYVLKRDRCDVVPITGGTHFKVILSNNTREYFGIESGTISGGNFLYMTARSIGRMNVFLLTNKTVVGDTNIFADQNYYGWGGSDFYDFHAKFMKINPADGSYWFVRYHEPIQTENDYPESEEPPVQEQIRKYTYGFSVSNLAGIHDDNNRPKYIVGLRVPGGRCSGMAFHRGRLYVMYRTPVNDHGTVRFGNESSKTIFIIDPRTMTYVGKVSQKLGGYANGLCSDGNNLYTIGSLYATDYSGYNGTFLVKMNIPN